MSTTIIGIDQIPEIDGNPQIASEFKSRTEEQILAIENKTCDHFETLLFFRGLSE